MRTIKFRGKRVDTGEFVFGCYLSGYYSKGEIHVIIDRDGDEFDVEPKSVKQLAGYDSDGNEVYAGDELVDYDGREWKAVIKATAVSTIKGVSHDINTLELKEA